MRLYLFWGRYKSEIEAVALSVNCDEVCGVGGIFFDLSAYLEDEVIDRASGSFIIVRPSMSEQVITGIDMTWVASEEDEEFACARREVSGLAVSEDAFMSGFEGDIVEGDGGFDNSVSGAYAAHGSGDASEKFSEGEGFSDVVIGAEFESADFFIFARTCG